MRTNATPRGGRTTRLAATLTGTALLGASLLAAPALADTGTVLDTESVSYAGEAGGIFGTSVSATSCDVNGDGHGDTIVGDWRWDRPGFEMTGAGYVVLGGEQLPGGHVDEPNPSRTIRIDGPSEQVPAGAWVGWSVSCLGDVNADGIDDFVLGTGSRNYHKVHVIFGSRELSSIDLDFLGSNGFIIQDSGAQDKTGNDKSTDNFGFSVAAMGDVDGDGKADIGVSDLLADYNGRTNSGRSWVISGSDSPRTVDVSNPADAQRVLLSVDGANANDRAANLIALGDVNGDGRQDFGTSAYTAAAPGGNSSAGAGFVVFGQEGSAHVDLADLGEHGFTVAGPERGADRLGISLAAAGDVNNDGLADVLLGADGVSREGAARNGGAALVYGAESTATVLTHPEATAAEGSEEDAASVYECAGADCAEHQPRGFWINGVADASKLGTSVASLSDQNGDGSGDLLLGSGNGIWAVFGDAARTATLELSEATSAQAAKVADGPAASLGNAGDMNGDGGDDLVIGGANTVNIMQLKSSRFELALEVPEEIAVGEQFTATAKLSGAAVPQDQVAGTVGFTLDGQPVAQCQELEIGSEVSCDMTRAAGEPADGEQVEGESVAAAAALLVEESAPAEETAASEEAAEQATEAEIEAVFTPAADSALGKLTDSRTVRLAAAPAASPEPTEGTEEPTASAEPTESTDPTDATEEPGTSGEPTESSEPSESSEPTQNTEEPGTSEEPTESTEPTDATEEPGASEEPTESSEPTQNTEAPGNTAEPTESSAPGQPSESSKPTDAPEESGNTEEPGESSTPEESNGPTDAVPSEGGEDPENSEEPQNSQAPSGSTSPGETPDSTESTDAPESSEGPDVVEATKPGQDTDPEDRPGNDESEEQPAQPEDAAESSDESSAQPTAGSEQPAGSETAGSGSAQAEQDQEQGDADTEKSVAETLASTGPAGVIALAVFAAGLIAAGFALRHKRQQARRH